MPRHKAIVAAILGETNAGVFTKLIGTSEVFMFVWVLSGFKSRWCAIVQITVVATMNIIEFVCVPDLLLFGRMNIVVAAFFISIVYINEFVISPQPKTA